MQPCVLKLANERVKLGYNLAPNLTTDICGATKTNISQLTRSVLGNIFFSYVFLPLRMSATDKLLQKRNRYLTTKRQSRCKALQSVAEFVSKRQPIKLMPFFAIVSLQPGRATS